MNRRRIIPSLVFTLLLTGGSARAQTFYFANGQQASLPEARIEGDNIIVPIKTNGASQVSGAFIHPISTIQRMDWPEPPAIAAAEADLAAGKFASALRKIEPQLNAQNPFRLIAGSWWSHAAVIKATALARLGRDIDVEVMLELMRQAKSPAGDLLQAELALIDHLSGSGRTNEARARLKEIEDGITDDDGLAELTIIKGKLAAQAGHDEDALLAYLRVPVFHPDQTGRMPAALLGAIRAYRKLGEDSRAEVLTHTLLTRFPESAEAATLQN